MQLVTWAVQVINKVNKRETGVRITYVLECIVNIGVN